jgi:LmbE family N-acetylglucosaminyl deacetylase
VTTQAIIVSPHLDDAALSCGGGIARLVRGGVSVTVVSVFTGDQPPGRPLSTLARRSHASWGIGDQPFAVRRAEDEAAARLLGYRTEHLGLLDAIYRRSASGEALYARQLSAPAPEDIADFLPRLVDALRGSALRHHDAGPVFCPAGIGSHPDHVLTRQAVEQIAPAEKLVYYDEYPYSARPGVLDVAAGGNGGWPVQTLELTPEDLDARIAAIGCYDSQLRGLFPSTYERLREIASARLPVVGAWLARPPDPAASRPRMAEQVRREIAVLGGERYRWSPSEASPFPEA